MRKYNFILMLCSTFLLLGGSFISVHWSLVRLLTLVETKELLAKNKDHPDRNITSEFDFSEEQGTNNKYAKKNFTTNIVVDCDPKSIKTQNILTTASTIRIRHLPCQKQFRLKKILIKGSKHEPTIFTSTDGNTYRTDYIPINIGQNMIELIYDIGNKLSKKRNIKITRSRTTDS